MFRVIFFATHLGFGFGFAGASGFARACCSFCNRYRTFDVAGTSAPPSSIATAGLGSLALVVSFFIRYRGLYVRF
jgi:hypothetical protein